MDAPLQLALAEVGVFCYAPVDNLAKTPQLISNHTIQGG